MEEIYLEKAILVGVDTKEDKDFESSMKELGSLAEACNMKVVGMMTQNLPQINTAYYIGTGKLQEVKEFAEDMEAEVIIFDNGLTPSQLRNLQNVLEMPILDRTTLILDIFSVRAKTREAKLQVETAKLQYLLPRLVGMHKALTRQGGGSGSMSNKGAGEKKLELDRRKIQNRITELKKELEEVSKERETQRKRRMESGIPKVSLVGYTNAGKSTIMNLMVDRFVQDDEKKVLEKDMLFATLETSVRKIALGNHKDFLLSDTVGFIHKLPHGLVKAFRSTLEEVKNADLLLHVVDFSDPDHKKHMEVTLETLKEMDAAGIPMITVFNKADKTDMNLPKVHGNTIYMSAKQGIGLTDLLQLIEMKVYRDTRNVVFLIPYNRGDAVSYLLENSTLLEQEFLAEGTLLKLNCKEEYIQRFKEFLQEGRKEDE